SSSRGSSSSSRGRSSSSRGFSSSSRSYSSGSSRTTIIYSNHGSNSYHSGPVDKKSLFITLLIISAIFSAVMSYVSLNEIIRISQYGTVSATAISNDYHWGYYYTTYEYYVDGKLYVEESDVGWELEEREGKVVTIYYLKSDPSFITEENPFSFGSGMIIFFTLACIASTITFAVLLKRCKSVQPANISSEEEPASEPIDDRITCRYCGTKYDKSKETCPSCGASNKYN
ncbi:MAG: hypothetical protein IKC49_03635, partial [Clostridia bacterium]|nr:hypothetical protein [Clostridia bacterium]